MSQFISFTDRPLTRKELKRVEKFYKFFTGKKMVLVPRVEGLRSVLRATVEDAFFTRLREFNGPEKRLAKFGKKRIENKIREFGLDGVPELVLPYKVYRTFKWILSLLSIDEIDYLVDLGIHVEVVRTKNPNVVNLTNVWSFQMPRYEVQLMYDFPEEYDVTSLSKGEQYWVADTANRNWSKPFGDILLELWVRIDNANLKSIRLNERSSILQSWFGAESEGSLGELLESARNGSMAADAEQMFYDNYHCSFAESISEGPADTLTAEG